MRASHQAFLSEIGAARVALAQGDPEATFARLERAHILGQLRFVDHVGAHLWMLHTAWRRSDGREVLGQVLRLIATVPGHLFGWLPVGNTGGANVPALRPMPIPADLQPFFEGFSLRRRILRQWALLGVLALAAGIGFAR